MHSRWARIQPSAEQVRLEAALCAAIVARSSPLDSRFGDKQPCAQQIWPVAALCTAGFARSSPCAQ